MFCEVMFKAPIVNPEASTGKLLGITDLMLLIEAYQAHSPTNV